MKKFNRLLRFLSSKQSLSESLSWGIDRNMGKMRPDYSVRMDREDIPVCEGVYIQVYNKELRLGRGPACSLFMLDEEVLRIDCFGKGAGHLHIAFFLPGSGENRLWMYEATVEEQVARAKFELHRNFRYYQARVPNPKIRALEIGRQEMKAASELAFEKMTRFIELFPQGEVVEYEAYGDDIE
ncbi:MAG: hypothetical protein P8L44_04560 [Opitutales bacterium]|nr:hypothetical protein [Opitutales bacterium]